MNDTSSSASSTVVPLFPLPNLYLFPGAILPLHIFEPRYRQMVEDLLDGPGRLVLGTVLSQDAEENAESPSVHPVAGLGEIGRHERMEDGRFLILVVGLRRVALEEVESDRLYRKVKIRELTEIGAEPEEQEPLKQEIIQALESRLPVKNVPLKMLPFGQLTDLLLLHLRLPQETMLGLYSERDVKKRAEGCLREHRVQPIPEPKESQSDFDEGEEGFNSLWN